MPPPLPFPIKSPPHRARADSWGEGVHAPHSVATAMNGFAKKSTGVYQTLPRLLHEPIAESQTGFKTNQSSKTAMQKSHFGSQPAPSSPKENTSHPGTECSSMGGFGEAQVCCVFHTNACMLEPDATVKTLNSAIGKE